MNSMCNLIVSRYVKCKQKYDNYEDIYNFIDECVVQW